MARKKKQKPVKEDGETAPEGDLLYNFEATADGADRKAQAIVSVIVPAPPPAPLRPVPVAESTAEEENATDAWKRRAAARRLKANQPEGAYGDPAANEPVYTPRHELDPSPEFDREVPPGEVEAEALRRDSATGYRWRLLVTAGIVIALGLLTAAGRLLWIQSAPAQTPKSAPPRARKMQPGEIAASVPAAKRVVLAFYSAASPAEKQAFIRGGQALLPELERYYATHPDEPAGVTLADAVEFITDGLREFILITGEETTGARFEAPVELTAAGPRIDWRALKGTSEPWFNTWLEQRPAGRSFHRVVAFRDHLYTGAFSQSSEWLCLRVRDSSRNAAAWAYVPRSSSVAHRLLLNLQRSPAGIKICCEFEFPPAGDFPSTVPQVLLHSVQDKGWLDLSPEVQTSSTPSVQP